MIPLKLNESDASLRVVPLPPLLQASATTSAATNESGRTFYFSIGGVDYGSGGSLSAVSAAMGLYTCNFAASKLSVEGPGFCYYGLPTSSLTALQVSVPIMVVPFDSYDSMRLGLFALPNAAAEAAGGLITRGTGTGQLHVSSGSVGLIAQTHSGVTIKGLENYANISDVTLHEGTHSGATVGVGNIAPGTYSGVSVEVAPTGIVAGSIGAGALTSAKFAAGAIDAVALATDAGQEIADRVLLRHIAGGADSGRSVGQALYALRNRVAVEGSTMTVYGTDDSTSAWTASVTTGTNPLSGMDPVG